MTTIKTLFIASTLTFNVSMITYASDLEARKKFIKKMEKNMSSTALNRKARSEVLLKKYKVPINQYLPVIEDETEALVRTKEEIATRAMALLIVSVKAEGLEQSRVLELIKGYDLDSVLTPDEVAFIHDPSPSEHDKTQFIWRYEAAWVLLWALGYVDELTYPDKICDVPKAVRFMQKRTKDEFIADAKLRPISDILDQADLIYRYHWAVVDARIKGKQSPSNLDSSVVLERHYALNWLIGYMNQAWDDISTDT